MTMVPDNVMAALAGLALVALVAVVQAQTTSPASPPPPADEPAPTFDAAYLSDSKVLALGREVWQQQCRHCHGAAAYPGKAPKLSPGGLTPDFVYDRVTYGFGKMPSWKAVFTAEQRKAVAAYVKSDGFSP